MYDLKLGSVNHALCKAIRLIGACKRMVGPTSAVHGDLIDIDREVREAAGECQRVLKLIEEDDNRRLCNLWGIRGKSVLEVETGG